jgi:predicted signal transduction protein with EAL and GGDEF domain
MGIAYWHANYESGDQLLRDATTAMHQARALGRAGFVIFDSAMHEQAMVRLKLESDLRQALEREEFRLEYQPIMDLKSGQVAGFEALLRWERHEQGFTKPDEFLAVTMELGLMPKIGEWGLREACRQLVRWHAEFPNCGR